MPTEDRWRAELTPEQLDRFEGTRDQPSELIAALREDVDFLVALARADTRPHLLEWFSERDIARATGWLHDPERTGPIGPNAAGVEWSWEGVHDDKASTGTFNSITASGRAVTVRGFTLMGIEADQFMVRRYVDWAGLFAQLGLTLNWRTPVSPD